MKPQNANEIVAKRFGDGGLISGASDYAKFMRVFFNGGKTDADYSNSCSDLIVKMGENHIGDLAFRRQILTDPISAKDFP